MATAKTVTLNRLGEDRYRLTVDRDGVVVRQDLSHDGARRAIAVLVEGPNDLWIVDQFVGVTREDALLVLDDEVPGADRD